MHPNVLKNDVDLKLEFKVERTETSLCSEPSSDSSSKAYILKVEKLAESTCHPKKIAEKVRKLGQIFLQQKNWRSLDFQDFHF